MTAALRAAVTAALRRAAMTAVMVALNCGPTVIGFPNPKVGCFTYEASPSFQPPKLSHSVSAKGHDVRLSAPVG
jgi:hypothetical protein